MLINNLFQDLSAQPAEITEVEKEDEADDAETEEESDDDEEEEEEEEEVRLEQRSSPRQRRPRKE